MVAILASVIAITLESTRPVEAAFRTQLRAIEFAFTIVFTVEYALRLWCVDRPSRYALSFFGLVDLLSIAPTYFTFLFPGSQGLGAVRVLRLIRVFRVFALGRYSRAASLLSAAA